MQGIYNNISEIQQGRLREKTELLRSRLELLEGTDKEIMTMYLENGITYKQLAELTGTNECSIARRISKIQSRILDGKYITCLRNRNRFTPLQMALAKERFLNGYSINKISEKFHTGFHTTKRAIIRIERIIRSIRRPPSARPRPPHHTVAGEAGLEK